MISHALTEGISLEDFQHLPLAPDALEDLNAVPADYFFELHEFLDKVLGPGFSVRVGQQMEMDDYGVLGLSWKTCMHAGEIPRFGTLFIHTYSLFHQKIHVYQCLAECFRCLPLLLIGITESKCSFNHLLVPQTLQRLTFRGFLLYCRLIGMQLVFQA